MRLTIKMAPAAPNDKALVTPEQLGLHIHLSAQEAAGADQSGDGLHADTGHDTLTTEIPGRVLLYADGACSGNPGVGGWGAVLKFADGSQHQLSGGHPDTTNNRMELLGVINALQYLSYPHKVDVCTDSQYVVKTMTEGWQRKKNQDLWRVMDELAAYHNLTFHWVRGHSGNVFNELCDVMAKDEIRRLCRSSRALA